MGGFGSGLGTRGGRTVAEDCLRLDVRAVHRAGYLGTAPRWGTWQWTYGSGDRASIGFTGNCAAVTLDYRAQGEPRRYAVSVEWTPGRFGGRVPWFRCPGRGCGRRCAILFCAEGVFACRRCNRLAYASQNETALDRQQRKARKAWKRVGCDFPEDLDPVKPKGMQWRTYARLSKRASLLGSLWSVAFDDRIMSHFRASGARLRGLAARVERSPRSKPGCRKR
jgi:hypothetical protein